MDVQRGGGKFSGLVHTLILLIVTPTPHHAGYNGLTEAT